MNLTKEQFLKKFPDQKCEVTYLNKGVKNCVSYDSFKHINWNCVLKIKIFFSEKKVKWDEKYGDLVSRDGVSIKIV